MSTISVNSIQGLPGSNVVVVPEGHNLETYGKLAVQGSIKVPTWDESTKPDTNLVVGQIGYNTELLVAEIWTGEETGWSTSVLAAAQKTLAESVGVTPYLHYQSSDLANYASGTSFNSSNPWKNNGSAGSNFDLVSDTNGANAVTVNETNGFKCANFSGYCGLAFRSAQYFFLETSSSNHTHTVAYVYSNGSNGSGNDSSPVFCGSTYGPSTSTPDRVGGGVMGWYSGLWRTWYDNDGSPSSISNTSGKSDSSLDQWIWTLNGGTVKGWTGKNSGTWVNQSWPAYGAGLPITGMGHVRRMDSSAYTTTGRVVDCCLFTDPLTDSQVQLLRDYYAEKYPAGNVAS